MKILSARTPKYNKCGGIDVFVLFEEFPNEELPFSAHPQDNEAHGRELYARALAGEFGEIQSYIPPVVPAPTEQETLAILTSEVQKFLDTKPKERNYDGILSLCTYATSTNPKFATEGQAGVIWRDAVWAKCYEIMAQVKAGERATPTVEELIAELPVFKWPDEQ